MFKGWISILGDTDNKKIVNVAIIALTCLLILHLTKVMILDSIALILIAFIVMLILLPYTEYFKIKDFVEWKRKVEEVKEDVGRIAEKTNKIKGEMAELKKLLGSFSGRLTAEKGKTILGLLTHGDIIPSFDIAPIGRDDLRYTVEKVGGSTYKISFFDMKGNPVQEDIEFNVIATWSY